MIYLSGRRGLHILNPALIIPHERTSAVTESVILYDGPVINRSEAESLGLKFFFTGKPCKYGHIDQRRVDNRTCEECSRFRNKRDAWKKKKYAEENEERVRESKKRWARKNRGHIVEKSRKWRLENKEEKSRQNSIWWKNNRDKARVYNSRRRKLIKDSGGSYTESDILNIMKLQNGLCAEPTCRVDVSTNYHIDHIMPIKLGGGNDSSNLQILCPRCNSRKYAKHPIDWARENGRLL